MLKISDITRQALLDHATDVFAENGFDRASVREITRRATVNQAAIKIIILAGRRRFIARSSDWHSPHSMTRRYSPKTQSAV
jgi:hypothetical protein